MRRHGPSGLCCVVLCLVLAGCDNDTPSPPVTPDPGGVQQITGNERLGWDQRASTRGDLAAIRYTVYVDGAGSEMQDVRCSDSPGAAGFECSGRLPAMSPGRHTLALSAFVIAGGGRLESPRSATITVNVGQSLAPPPATGVPTSTSIVTLDGVELRAVALASGFEDPTDLAIAPDGRTFVAERAGRIRVVSGGTLQPVPAIVLDDVLATDRRGLLSLAIAPDYEKTGHVFAVYTTPTGFRVIRLRRAGDTLGDAVAILDGVDAPLPAPAASLRFGPDHKLYLALDDGGDPCKGGDIGSFSGKVLRLNPDGTTPTDQAGATPVFALDLSSPRGLDWQPWDADTATLWVVEDVGPGTGRLLGVQSSSAPKRGQTVAHYRLPAQTGPVGMAFYRGDLVPQFAGNLFVASGDGAAILRLRFDPANAQTIVASERLLQGTLGRIGAVAVSFRGVLNFFAGDSLFMLTPEGPGATARTVER